MMVSYSLDYTTAQRNSLTPVKGQVIYNTTSNTLNAYDGVIWKDYQGPTPWNTNASDIYYSTGQVGINTSSPQNQLHVISDGTTTNMVRLDGAITPSGRDIVQIIVDAGTGDSAQFIEMQRGSNIVASINTDGTAKFKSVQYNTPRTHYYSVGDGDFKSALGNAFSTSFGNGGAYMSVAGTQVMTAGLHLPDGATITEFTAYVDDNDDGDLSIRISKLNHGGNGFVTVANVISSGTPGITSYTDNTISNGVVDNQSSSYHVRVFSSNWPGNSSLKN